MARRYVVTVLGVALEDIAIRHLERGMRFVLQHLSEKGVEYQELFSGESHATHRRFSYSDKRLREYENSNDFSTLLNDLSTKRILKDLSEWVPFTQRPLKHMSISVATPLPNNSPVNMVMCIPQNSQRPQMLTRCLPHWRMRSVYKP